ncbi:DgyrCDS13991 [Dimorphilus gyrociliatus]|uniref:DgyrCDS13991 n=1 Tax=Dimorphilus gyrociliatus TaxID=2664684 RepID=A0A7I8WCG4_9ANNE|nr:DgyrCDS13991 [Dimorphilus gyrociliatus]
MNVSMSSVLSAVRNFSLRRQSDIVADQARLETVSNLFDCLLDSENGTTDINALGRRIRVYMSVTFLKIGEIDTLKEQYEADVLIKSRWREPTLDKKSSTENNSTIDWRKFWNPKLFIENTIGDPREFIYRNVKYDGDGRATVIEKKRVKGTFLENLELEHFPFDVQDLTVNVMSEREVDEIELVDDEYDFHSVNGQSFVDEQEWRLYKHIETEHKEVHSEFSEQSVKRSAVFIKCRAARRPAYFFWNIFLITFIICTLSFTTFSVQRDLPQNRLQLSFTLVLTSVAFKFVVNQSLPKISYLTYLDKYVLAAMILLSSVCGWHALTPYIKVPKYWESRLEIIAVVLFAGSYLGYNIFFITMIFVQPGSKRREMSRKEREYMTKLQTRTSKLIELKTSEYTTTV